MLAKTPILLLDIKMPKMDGLAVLEHIREAEELRRLPVVILTTSKAGETLGTLLTMLNNSNEENFGDVVD